MNPSINVFYLFGCLRENECQLLFVALSKTRSMSLRE